MQYMKKKYGLRPLQDCHPPLRSILNPQLDWDMKKERELYWESSKNADRLQSIVCNLCCVEFGSVLWNYSVVKMVPD